MTMGKKALKKKIAVYLVVAVLLSIFELVPIPSAMAATPLISINPTSGVVGGTVTASGQINTTDGAFTIRWNQAFNFTGVAVGNNFTRSLSVPSTAGGNIVVELIDETLDTIVATTDFTLIAKFGIHVDTLPSPRQLQEGNKTNVKINVTGGLPNTRYPANITVKNPANQTHSAIVLLSNTTATGSGNKTLVYPTDFADAHTNLTGTYIVSSNVTANVAEFFVGLTDKFEYRRNENVLVQVAGYKPSKVATADIRINASSVAGFPRNLTVGSSGLLTVVWQVPVNATPGRYNVTFTNATSDGTVKTPRDSQEFRVLGSACLIRARNLANETVEGASIEVYNANTTSTVLNKGDTNSTGWIRFNLDDGNYTFKAFVKNVQVGSLANEVIMADTELNMTLSLVNFNATVKTEEGEGIPLIEVALIFSYKTRDNKTVTETATAQTNATGMAAIRELFTNKTYRVEATRYGLLFRNSTVEVGLSPVLGWISVSLTLPNHTLTISAKDSKGLDAVGVDLRVYEWASGVTTPVGSTSTNSSGNAFFSLQFGRYILMASKGDDFLSETIVDLVESSKFTLNLVTLNLDVSVYVRDYFGQPIANAEVKIERKIGQDFVLVSTQLTGSAGDAQFDDIVGGDSRVSAYVGGTLVAVQTQFLGAGSNEVVLKVAEFIAVLGYPISSGAFALLVFVLVLIVAVLVVARRRILQVFRKPSKR
jgi:hypothetical protein